jgi:hypothetical protein
LDNLGNFEESALAANYSFGGVSEGYGYYFQQMSFFQDIFKSFLSASYPFC